MPNKGWFDLKQLGDNYNGSSLVECRALVLIGFHC